MIYSDHAMSIVCVPFIAFDQTLHEPSLSCYNLMFIKTKPLLDQYAVPLTMDVSGRTRPKGTDRNGLD